MPSKKVDVQDLIRFVTSAFGKLPLATERINREFDTDYKKEDVLSAIAGHSGDLAEQLRTLLVLQMFDTQQQIQLSMVVSLPELSPSETARLYTANAVAIGQLSSRPIKVQDQEPVNIIEAKRKFVGRLEDYKQRKIDVASKEELEATGTDGPTLVQNDKDPYTDGQSRP